MTLPRIIKTKTRKHIGEASDTLTLKQHRQLFKFKAN